MILLLSLAATSWLRADEYITIDPGELKSNPQSFWARGIVFSDIVENLNGGEAVKLGDKRYTPILTRLVGTCYLDPEMEGGVDGLQAGQEYAFSGSVYQKDGGFFSSKRQFYVVIKRATLSAKGAGILTPEQLSALASTTRTNIYTEPLRVLDDVVAQAMRELQAYCSASNITMQEVFDPQSRHAPRLIQSVRQAIYNQENKSRVPAVEYLVTLVASFMANQQGLLTPPAPAPEPVVVAEPPAVIPPENAGAIELEVITEPVPEVEAALEPAPAPAPAAEPPPVETIAPIEPLPEPVVEEQPAETVTPTEPAPVVVEEPMVIAEPEPVVEPVPVVEPAPVEVVTEVLLEQPVAPAVDEPVVVEAVEPEIPTLIDPVSPPDETAPEPAPVAPVIEAPTPVELAPEPVPEPVSEEVAPPRRSSTLPAATLKLPAAPDSEKPKKSKAKKKKVTEPEPEPAPETPAKKPSLLDADPNAPVPLR